MLDPLRQQRLHGILRGGIRREDLRKRTGRNLLSCRMQDNLKDNMYLNPNGTILIEVGVQIFSDDCDQAQPGSC